MHEGLDRNRIRKHLGAFSASAPLLAVITYFGLSQVSVANFSSNDISLRLLDVRSNRDALASCSVAESLTSGVLFVFQQSKETLSSVNATGIAMLFSAGTFLYVATVHVLPEIASMGSTRRTVGADGSVIVRETKGFSKVELTLLVIGAMLPLVLALGHSH